MILLKFNCDIDLGVIIGFVSLILGGIAFFKSLRLEKQQYKLNKYALENEETKREEEKYAKIRITPVEKLASSNYMIIKMENYGKCDATEIEVLILGEYGYHVGFDHVLPKSLKEGESIEIGLHCYDNRYDIEYEVRWKDRAGKHSEQSRFRNTTKR